MYAMAVVIGTVVEAFEDHGAKFLVVLSKDTAKWKGHVACRFYGEAGKWAAKAQNGDLVKIDGEPSSRKHKDRWFTEFNARYLEVLRTTGSAAAPEQQPSLPAGGDEDGIPF
jgi:hypothetical protein